MDHPEEFSKISGKISGIYCFTNKVNGKKLIGLSSDIRQRFSKYKSALKYGVFRNIYFQNSWNKHGDDNFEFSILELCSVNKLGPNERKWIKFYKSNVSKFGYNRSSGGVKNVKYIREVGRKISKSLMGHPTSDETKKKLSKSATGRIKSLETRRKLSKANKGKKRTLSTRKRISKAMKGRVFSEEHCKNLSKAKRGKPLSEKALKALIGRKASEEAKWNISKSFQKRFYKNKTGFKGVQGHGIKFKYGFSSAISYKNQRIYIGLFKTNWEAAEAYDKKAIELFGEGALTNKKIKIMELINVLQKRIE